VNIAIAVYGSPTTSCAHRNALGFVRAALAAGHSIERVFFYHDAVLVGSALVVSPQDESDFGLQWATLAAHHGFELAVCVAAALRRGILDATEAKRYDRGSGCLREPFELVGLGQLAAAAIDAERLVTFI